MNSPLKIRVVQIQGHRQGYQACMGSTKHVWYHHRCLTTADHARHALALPFFFLNRGPIPHKSTTTSTTTTTTTTTTITATTTFTHCAHMGSMMCSAPHPKGGGGGGGPICHVSQLPSAALLRRPLLGITAMSPATSRPVPTTETTQLPRGRSFPFIRPFSPSLPPPPPGLSVFPTRDRCIGSRPMRLLRTPTFRGQSGILSS